MTYLIQFMNANLLAVGNGKKMYTVATSMQFLLHSEFVFYCLFVYCICEDTGKNVQSGIVVYFIFSAIKHTHKGKFFF